MNKDIPIGSFVTMNKNSRWASESDPSNPVDVIGEVIAIPQYRIDDWGSTDDGWVWVQWPNKYDNCYPDDEDCLVVVKPCLINMATRKLPEVE